MDVKDQAYSQRVLRLLSQHQAGFDRLAKLENLQEVANVDQGASLNTLTRVSHIYLFGIAFIFMFVGWIFALAEFPKGWKALLIAIPFIFLLADIFFWWMIKFAPEFAWLTLIGGICYSVASTVMIFASLGQM